MIHELSIETTHKLQMVDMTDMLTSQVQDVADGLALFTVPHTSAALIICEDDPAMHDDVLRVAADLFANYRPFKHAREGNPNAEAHLLSSFAGTQLTFAVQNGALTLGRFQRIYFLELDGPRHRRVQCYVLRANSN